MRQMRHEVISSRSNPLVTRLRKLGSKRSARREEGVFVGEGPKLLQEAVRWRIPLETVVYASGVTLPQLPDDVRVVEVPDSLLEAVAQTQTPQGVVFVCRTPALELPEQLTGNRYLILDGLQDPGNVGTIWRTADAFGADGLILCSGCADPWSPKTVRSTMGAAFRLPLATGVRYLILLVCFCIAQAVCSMFSILALSMIQESTPEHLTGKIMACVIALSTCAQPAGQVIYGLLFDLFSGEVWLVILPTAAAVIAAGCLSADFLRRFFRETPEAG